MIVLLVVTFIWIVHRFRRWMDEPLKQKLPFEIENTSTPTGEAVDILEAAGYEVISGKQKISMKMNVQEAMEKSTLYSRVFIDYFARDEDGLLYVVKVEKHRYPMEWTGSAVRDRLLLYWMLYEHKLAGLLHVNINANEIKKLTFEMDR